MAELILELYSEEIPPQLQISARSQIKQFIENFLKENDIKHKELLVFSSPTRLTLFIRDLVEKIKKE
ncbi:MAG: glycine--tRNA ligase subunit beta, partial [Pseudomonadota bacterium]|nr:glycine--tRNA ligase subunit beta [Pseudomonadota bacterium]